LIRDSATIRAPIETRTDVCVIGGGTAGLFLATALRRRGVDVVVLELGGTTAQRPHSGEQFVQQRGIHYRGAELGRCFGLGGTSVLWGGQMIPVTRADVAARPWADIAAWPVSYAAIAAYFPEVARSLGLGAESTLEDHTDDAIIRARFQRLAGIGDDFTIRLSTWLPFKTRNFSQEFAETLRNDDRLCVWLNAAVTSLNTFPEEGHRRITSVSARNSEGQTLQIHAPHFVICAGALESTRLLLEHDDHTGGSLTRLGSPLGRYFSDHLSATCGRFQRHAPGRFNNAVAPIFCRGLMRTPRLELSAAAQETRRLPSAFAHVTFRTDGKSGFDIVRNFLRRKQGEQHSLGLYPGRLGRVVHDVTAMAYWRYLQARLWIPTQAEVLLQIDLEQIPNPESRLFLSDERDVHGRKRLIVDWRITPRDVAAIRTVTQLAGDRWNTGGLTDLATLELVPEQSFDSFEMLYDVYHPTGTLRMGIAPSDSVVDANLRAWALENCYVSTTAVFPSAGSANPGFTHLALTARLADHLARLIRQGVALRVSPPH
jgi:choline dehydrogenase-like flavoprotein